MCRPALALWIIGVSQHFQAGAIGFRAPQGEPVGGDAGQEPREVGPDTSDLDLAEPKPLPNPLPLCYHSIVSETCRKVNDGRDGATVSRALLVDLLSTEESIISSFFSTLRLRGGDASCVDLCNATVEYFQRAGDLPPNADVACFTVDGETECDVNVEPHSLAKETEQIDESDPDVDVDQEGAPAAQPQAAEGNLLAAAHASGAAVVSYQSAPGQSRVTRKVEPRRAERRREAALDAAAVPASLRLDGVHQVACRVANMYRFYPACAPVDVTVEPVAVGDRLDHNASRRASTTIAARHTTAKAWESTLLRELGSFHTQGSRQKWFGGPGALSESDVRQRIVKTMNFVKRELDNGIHYVYPANNVPGNGCAKYTLAFVYKEFYPPRSNGYAESTMPVCDVDPSQKLCAIDRQGKYVVYICEWYMKFPDWKKVGTILHEVVHHTNPVDISYDEKVMQKLTQAEQLNNADNYAHFGSDVVQHAWSCNEPDKTQGLPFKCGGSDCSCAQLAAYCDHQQLGAAIRGQCPASCGACSPPAVTAHPHPVVQQTTTAAPSPAPVVDHHLCEDCAETGIKSKSSGQTYSCSQLVAYCENAQWGSKIKLVCPSTCDACPPASCVDQDESRLDAFGDHCVAYWGQAGWCGRFDDQDFSSNEMCCACKAA